MLPTMRGLLALISYIFNLLICGILLLGWLLIVYLMPALAKRYYDWLPKLWISINNWISQKISRLQWHISATVPLSIKSRYLILANHQSWADILLLQYMFHQKVSMLKFLLKKQLRWLPVIGQAAVFYGCPFLSRYSEAQLRKHPKWRGQDLAKMRLACQRFNALPGSLIIFVEGTRFTTTNQQIQHSPYANLLKPRAGGLALALQTMNIDGLIDVTIRYPITGMNFWHFCCGKSPINVHIRTLAIKPELIGDYEQDADYRKNFQQVVNAWWQEKQAIFTTL